MRVALVCIAKNEDLYIEEWIKYNSYLGFDKIFIYENDWRLNYDNEIIHKIPFDGIAKQVEAYNNFIIHHKNEWDWVAFFDVDEFLVLKQHNNIKEFLSNYNEFDGVAINWYLFGDNNQPPPTDNYSVLERFTKRGSIMRPQVKSIIKPNRIFRYDVHAPSNQRIVDTKKRAFIGELNYQMDDEIAQLNHYFTKTWKEWELKRDRGRSDIKNSDGTLSVRTDDNFQHHNTNDVEDLLALEFWKKHNP